MDPALQTNLIHELFDQAVDLPPDQRQPFLRATGAAPAVRESVQSLLDAHERASAFLADPTIPPEQLAARFHLQPGARIDRYTILRRFGEGGYGTVYLAQQDPPLVRRVALKLIKAGMDTGQVIARFQREREALARMDHPNIARVYDAGGTEAGRPFFVMEWIDGEPITVAAERRNLDLRTRLELFLAVCSAVQHAHDRGILHRDLKPPNVLLTTRDPITPKVIDFGVAKALAADEPDFAITTLTIGPNFLGTPQYMSPEQANHPANLDARTDVYGLGALLYELLTNTPPLQQADFTTGDYARVLRNVHPPLPSARLADKQRSRQLRGELDCIVAKAIEKNPAHRYESAAALAADICRYLDGQPIMAAGRSTRYRTLKWIRRRKRTALAIAVATIAVALLLIFLLGSTPTVPTNDNDEAGPAVSIASHPTVAQDIAGPLAPGLIGELFDGMRFLGTPAKLRMDPAINFSWREHLAPEPQLQPPKYSIRWRGVIIVPPGGARIGASANDGAELVIDGQNQFRFTRPAQRLSPTIIPPGKHSLELDYWNRIGAGHVKLIWQLPANPTQIIPAAALWHSPTPGLPKP